MVSDTELTRWLEDADYLRCVRGQSEYCKDPTVVAKVRDMIVTLQAERAAKAELVDAIEGLMNIATDVDDGLVMTCPYGNGSLDTAHPAWVRLELLLAKHAPQEPAEGEESSVCPDCLGSGDIGDDGFCVRTCPSCGGNGKTAEGRIPPQKLPGKAGEL